MQCLLTIGEKCYVTDYIPQDKYNEIISLIPIVCVDVAIVYDAKILLVKRRDEPAAGEWWLPGGRLYKGEALEDCALRKAKKETGLECEAGPMIYYASIDFGTVHSVNFCYLLSASNDRVRLDYTCLECYWIDGQASILHSYIRNCLSKAFDYLRIGVSAYDT